MLDAPPTIRHNIQRAIDEIAAAYGIRNTVTHLIYSHHHAYHVGTSSLFDTNVTGSDTRKPGGYCCATTTRPGRRTPNFVTGELA